VIRHSTSSTLATGADPVCVGRLVVNAPAATARSRSSQRARGRCGRLSLDGGKWIGHCAITLPQLVTRVHRAVQTFGANALNRWDEVESETGMSRTFRIDLDPRVPLLPLCHDLRAIAHVDSVSPEYLSVTPFAAAEPPGMAEAGHRPSEASRYAHRMVRAAEALAFEPGDMTLVVGIIDSGLELGHAEVTGRYRPGYDFVDLARDRLSRSVELVGDVANPDRSPHDDMGHGTGCAGIIAARGLSLEPGLGGACWVLPGRALAAARLAGRRSLSAVGATEDISAAMKRVVDLGARVINMSFGTPASALREDDPIPHADVVAYALQRGVVLVAASGNDGSVAAYYPAALEGVIAVGSVGESGMPSAFSTRGDHVALSAPGESIRVPTVHGRYAESSGTSFAAPFVSGTCALLAARSARYGTPLTPRMARSALVDSARPSHQAQSLPAAAPGSWMPAQHWTASSARCAGRRRFAVTRPPRGRTQPRLSPDDPGLAGEPPWPPPASIPTFSITSTTSNPRTFRRSRIHRQTSNEPDSITRFAPSSDGSSGMDSPWRTSRAHLRAPSPRRGFASLVKRPAAALSYSDPSFGHLNRGVPSHRDRCCRGDAPNVEPDPNDASKTVDLRVLIAPSSAGWSATP
jgi:hypothetical protein